jgi:hypothetical protein
VIGRLLQRRRPLPDDAVLSGPAGHGASDARKPQVDITWQVAGEVSTARPVIAREDDGGLPGQAREPGARGGQLLTPDCDEDDVVVSAGIRDYGDGRIDLTSVEDVAR